MGQTFKNGLFLAFSIAMAMGCAGKYYLIEPQTLDFTNSAVVFGKKDITIAWRYNVLREAGNNKYARKERRNDVSLIALAIKNNSTDTLHFPGNIMVLSGEDELEVMTVDDAYFALCQDIYESRRGIGMADPLIIKIRDNINYEIQKKGNTLFVNELYDNYLFHRNIAPGTTLKGFICLSAQSKSPLRFVYSKN
jgi:hypothetical protein